MATVELEKFHDVTELAGSAYVNFQNVCRVNPHLMTHPIFKLAMVQLREALITAGVEPIDLAKDDPVPLVGL